MVQVSKIERDFQGLGKYQLEGGLLLRVTVQQGQTVSQLVVPENLLTGMFNHIMMTSGTRDILVSQV